MPKRGWLGGKLPLLALVSVAFLALFFTGFVSGPLGKSLLGDLGLPQWVSVSRPDPQLHPETVFNLLGFSITNTIIASWVTIIFLVGFCYAVSRRMKIVPGRLQSAFEFLLGWLYDFCVGVAGEKNGRRFFPIVATIFLFVAFNAWLSLIPGFGSIEIVNPEGHHVHLLRGANTDINMPLALALMSFVFVEYFGLRTLGLRYLVKFFNVRQFSQGVADLFRGKLNAGLSRLFTGAIDIFVGILETLSEFIRIVSFTFRLFGNMTAGEILLLIAMFLIPWVFALPFYGLELLVGFVQALIFGGLTLVFLTVAVAPHEAHEAEAH